MAQLQTSRPFQLTTPLGDDVLLFHRMTATEDLGRLFRLDLDLLSTEQDIRFEDILGQNITVRLTLPNGNERYFNGFVTQFRLEGSVDDYHHYSMTVHPWLWFLTRTSDCRIFQTMTVPDIVKTVFRDHGFTDFEESLGSYRIWDYCVQYRETDFNFVSRLLEQEGIYYFFKHENNKHTLVLSDSISAHAPYPGYESLPFYPPDDHPRPMEEHIYDWNVTQEIKPGTYALNEYDFTAPKANLHVKSSILRNHAYADMEIYDYPGEYPDAGNGETYARARIEALQTDQEIAHAQGNAMGLAVGSLFELANYPRTDQNREYLIVSAIHQMESDAFISGGASGTGPQYTCSFTAISSRNPYRSAQTTPKPAIQGIQTAVVVGPAGDEIHTDPYGRVKIQFHWDRYGKHDENSSCWVRVSHPTAGKGWGAVQIPRIGQEVIVEFLEGDPDRPIITGRVYNNDNMPPYGLPAGGMVSGMKSNSTPGGGGYNEMSMNDTKGEEKVTIHAQFDMDTTVENDQTLTVHNNRTTTIDVDDTETVSGNQTINIGVDQKETIGSNKTESIGANETRTIGKNKTETVTINTAETIGVAKELSIGGAYQVSVGAAMNETVIGAKAEEIGAVKSVNVGGNSSENIGGNKSVNAGKDISESAGKDVIIQSGKKMALTAGDDFAVSGRKKGVIEIKDELTIKVGKALIKMKKNGDIAIKGAKIEINGSGDTIIKGKKILQN